MVNYGREQQDREHRRVIEHYKWRALQENIFTDFYNKYDHQDTSSPEVLDALFVELYESEALTALRDQLEDNKPRYTTVYRYDPFNIHYTPSAGCFRGGVVHGAEGATTRVFRDLTPDKVQLWRTENEVLVLIDHPSHKVQSRYATDDFEPTVLFSSTQLGSMGYPSRRSIEEAQIGLAIAHGDTPLQAMPPSELLSNVHTDYFLNYAYSEKEAGHIPRVFSPRNPQDNQE